MHVTEEDLILHYYGEAADEQPVEQHLTSCAACRREFQRLKQALALVDAEGLAPTEAPRPEFERDVWARLEPQLPRRRSWLAWTQPSPLRWAIAGGALAALLVAAFTAGRFSQSAVPASGAPTVAAADNDGVAERVLVVAVVDHLDRSQLVLLEVLNADFAERTTLGEEQSLARELVASNRLYRQTAVRAGDDQTGDVLDELERVLLEIANAPQGASRGELEALRERIAARGLLFKVRVVHSEMRERERQTWLSGGTS